MNPYIQNLNRIEFLITLACTGKCKHCSEGEHTSSGSPHIDTEAAVNLVKTTAQTYKIQSLMTFGGEPLLYPEAVCAIHAAAREAGIKKRQLITNGFFSRDEAKIQHVAKSLAESGVNDVLLSVDAFHQETIPLEPVMIFAKVVHTLAIANFRVHPAWLAGANADNPYNEKTREILAVFHDLGIPSSDGNVIFPGGNALKYLSEYFELSSDQKSPYQENKHDIKSICINPDGDVLGNNIYRTDILQILKNYTPSISR